MTRNKVVGMFRGVAVGDALGAAVETFSVQKIANTFGRVDGYKPLDGHKWFDGHPLGTVTDDTQLTLATAEAIIEAKGIDMDAVARHHAAGLDAPLGWGGSTKDAIKKLAKGTHWSESGKTDKPRRGTGNGVAMKVSPVAAWCAMNSENPTNYMLDFAGMTHYTDIAVVSGVVMAWAVYYCLTTKNFDADEFTTLLDEVARSSSATCRDVPGLPRNPDDLADRISMLRGKFSPEEIIAGFGKGSCYVYDSLPFALAFFLRNPTSIETLYDVASAGGDTDSNASMVGALQGALMGADFFPKHLLDGLPCLAAVDDVADRFYDAADAE